MRRVEFMRGGVLALALALAAAPLAYAQETTQTAPTPAAAPSAADAAAPVAQPAGDETADQIAAWLRQPPAAAPTTPTLHADSYTDRQIHGEVGLTVSNRGYGGYGAVAMPLGDASELDVAVGGGHERLPGGRTVNPRSLAIGLYLDGGDVARWLSKDKCGVQHAVPLKGDAVVQADGSCYQPGRNGASAPPPAGS